MENEGEAWNFFEDILPPEIAELVFSYLSLEDIVYVSIVCKSWNIYFDTKDIWKRISEHYYGEISPKNVDLTQNFRWKRIFFALYNAHRWSKSFSTTHTSYEVPYQVQTVGLPEIGPSGQYLHTRAYSVDLKMAGKIVHMKREPITLHDRQWLAQCDYLVGESYQRLLNADGKGKFLFEEYPARKAWYLYDCEHFVTTPFTDHHVIQLKLLPETPILVNNLVTAVENPYEEFPADLGSFNSRFVVLANTTMFFVKRPVRHVIFDLQSTCSHVKPLYKDPQQQKKFERLRTGAILCKDHLLNTPFGVLGVFASKLVPEKIVFMLREPDEKKSVGRYVFYPKLAIWTSSEGLNEKDSLAFKHDSAIEVTNFSEHVIDEYHWLCFDMGQYTRIVDLNNFAHQFKLDLVQKRMWIPKKNKIVLVSGKKITVFDLQMNRWTSRMVCPNDVRAMTFNKSEKLLFVADSQFVHAFHWETARLISSILHPLAQGHLVQSLHVSYDQINSVSNRRGFDVQTISRSRF